MKHNLKVTIILIILFVLAQYIGIFITKSYTSQELPFDIEKPEFEEDTSYIPITILIIVATVIALFLARLKAVKIWKMWFFLSIAFCLTLAFGAFMIQWFALILALFFASWRTFRDSVILHNFTELFIYGGLAAIFIPVLNVISASVLLIIISIYDMIAVWKTKHMVSLAKFQAQAKIFAGLVIPYDKNKEAILGGGDIAFPILFTGPAYFALGPKALFIPLFVAAALLGLLLLAKKKKFYPAMPFVSIGCFLGYFIMWLI